MATGKERPVFNILYSHDCVDVVRKLSQLVSKFSLKRCGILQQYTKPPDLTPFNLRTEQPSWVNYSRFFTTVFSQKPMPWNIHSQDPLRNKGVTCTNDDTQKYITNQFPDIDLCYKLIINVNFFPTPKAYCKNKYPFLGMLCLISLLNTL